jgi:hypothetical protein
MTQQHIDITGMSAETVAQLQVAKALADDMERQYDVLANLRSFISFDKDKFTVGVGATYPAPKGLFRPVVLPSQSEGH